MPSNYKVHRIHHQSDHTWVVISGWAIDGRYCVKPTSNSSYVCISHYNPFTLKDTIHKELASIQTPSFSVAGFSMGAMWLLQHMDIVSNAKQRVLIGFRPSFSTDVISPIQRHLMQDKDACLMNFYHQCTSNTGLVKTLMHHRSEYELSVLIAGLLYLESRLVTSFQDLAQCKFIHGALDRIAPIREVRRLVSSDLLIILKRKGHLCVPDLDFTIDRS